MRGLGIAASLVLLALAIGACSDTLSPENLAGTYDLTSLELVNPANTSETFDGLQGDVCTIVITAAGGFTSTCESGDTVVGTIAIDGNDVTLVLDGDSGTGTITRDGDTVTIYLNAAETYDWDDDGTDEPADIRIIMTKTS